MAAAPVAQAAPPASVPAWPLPLLSAATVPLPSLNDSSVCSRMAVTTLTSFDAADSPEAVCAVAT